MKILLTTLNAKYIHSSLALYSIKSYCSRYKDYIQIKEYTINNEIDYIISEIYKTKANIICFSCYIWNIEMTMDIIKILKKLMKDVVIIVGGPEVSYDIEEFLKTNSEVDIVSYGEGEATFLELLDYFINKIGDLSNIKGIAYRSFNKIIINEKRLGLNLDDIPFVYNNQNLNNFENRIIYYETSRGCPYNCQYCLSSVEKGVRFLSLNRVYTDLQFFLDNNLKQVKFVDRTFNCNKNHALSIWKYLKENDNNITNFHFEITADLIDDEILEFLKDIRIGLFQFEIGVQSTNNKTINSIKRLVNFNKLSAIVKKIKSYKNIHQHLDLIAGLPYEDYNSFKKSFNDVYKLEPEQFQLGFLKLLKGSGLRTNADKYGLVYKAKAPYEILYTNDLNYEKLLSLKLIDKLIELYYNSAKAHYALKYMIQFFDTPFEFYEKLSAFWEANNYNAVQHNKMNLYIILMDFSIKYIKVNLNQIKDLLKFDIFLNDNVKTLPECFSNNDNFDINIKAKSFYNNTDNIKKYIPELIMYEPKQLKRMCHIERFEYDIISWIDNNILETAETFILFDYYSKSYITGHCSYYKI